MKAYKQSVVLLVGLFMLFFAITFAWQPQNPVLILAGESSPGTWLSGVLLIMAAGTALIIGLRRGWLPWYIASVFFFILAADERFMFHERLKEKIIFSFASSEAPRWLYELPVVLGACAGIALTILLWRHLQPVSRILLALAAIAGSISVGFDIMSAGVIWEDGFKLLAELVLVCTLLREVAVNDQ
jgi:hypothetical protein